MTVHRFEYFWICFEGFEKLGAIRKCGNQVSLQARLRVLIIRFYYCSLSLQESKGNAINLSCLSLSCCFVTLISK